jgi:hypothetical protein
MPQVAEQKIISKKNNVVKILAGQVKNLQTRINEVEETLVETIVDQIKTQKPKDGKKGDKGDKGDRGDAGDKGDKGNVGPQGPIGPQGLSGINGLDGKDGKDGLDGLGFINAKINDDSNLLIERTDGEIINAGKIKTNVINRTIYQGGGGSDRPYVDQKIAESAVTLAGENYLSISDQIITANPVNLGTSNVTGTTPILNGGTGETTANAAFNALAPDQALEAGKFLTTDGSNTSWSQIDISSDITGVLPITSGGTGEITANAALNALLPDQSSNAGKALITNGTNTSWDTINTVATVGFTNVASVTVNHNYGSEVLVQIRNTNREVIIPDKIQDAVDLNSFTVTFSSPESGTIIYGGSLNATTDLETVREVDDDYTVLSTDDTVKCVGQKSFTITLPSAVGISGKRFNIKHVGEATLTINTTLNQEIDGIESLSLLAGSAGAYPNLLVQSDNTGWLIL